MPCVVYLLYTNVLAVALLAASVAFDGVAVATLNTTPTPGLIKRYLQSHADTTTSGHTYNFEERVLPSSVESGVSTLLDGVKTVWGQVFSKSSNGLFKRYKLNKNKDKLFENPNFPKWVTRVTKAARKRNQDPFAKMIKTLSKQYNDDALLVKTLVTAPEIGNPKSTAAKLLDAQHKSWMNADESLENVFKLLKLDQTRPRKLFESPVFPEWVTYVENVSQKNNEDLIDVMFRTLSHQYEVNDLAGHLVEGARVNGMKDIALKLLDAQINNWKTAGKSVKDVFWLLKLHWHHPVTLFQSTVFPQWVTYAKEINPGSDKAATEAMFMVLSKKYSEDDVLFQILAAGAKVNGMEDTALKLLDAQINNWKNTEKSLKDVFRLLKLDQVEPARLFLSPVFPQWFTYVKNSHPGSEKAATEVMFKVLLELYTNDAARAQILAAGAKINGMKDTALKLVDDYLNTWKNARIPAKDVYELLVPTRPALRNIPDNLLLLRWLDYAKDLGTSLSDVNKILHGSHIVSSEIAVMLEGVITKVTGEFKTWVEDVQIFVFGEMYPSYTLADTKEVFARNGNTEQKLAEKYEDIYLMKEAESQNEVVPRL